MARIADIIWQHREIPIQVLEKTHVINKITNFKTGLYKAILQISCLIYNDTGAFLLKYHKVRVHIIVPIVIKDLWQLYY